MRKYRLRRGGDIMRVLKEGKFVRGKLVRLKYLEIAEKQKSREAEMSRSLRVTVVVSTKTFKKAVDRNRAKRLVRESVRHLLDQIKPGYDLVFLVQSEIVDKKQPEVEVEVKLLLQKANLLI